MFKLVIEDDEGNKTVVPVIRDEITIGRKDGNTIRLTERNVSRDHARLMRENGSVFVDNVSARYGTKKNGEKIGGRTGFSVGDVFTIGDYRLTLQSDAPDAKPPKLPKSGKAPQAPKPPGKPGFSNEPTQLTDLDAVAAATKEGTEIIAADPAKLVIVSSNFPGQEFPLARKEMVIGRGEECDIIIDHRSVSQKHAKVVRETTGEYKIVDLKSKNGVKVGGEEYRAVHLKRGDIIELGHVKFRFVESGENYVFTPPHDDDLPAAAPKRGGMVLAGVAVLLVLSAVAGFFLLRGDPTPEPIVVKTTPNKALKSDPVAAKPSANDASAMNGKIDTAEQDYKAGRVDKALGALQFLRDGSLTPEQVKRVDDLSSRARREADHARSFALGKQLFEQERWIDSLTEFKKIPDDAELNIYRLVKENQYVDNAVVSAADEQLQAAKDAEEKDGREEARSALNELARMFPSHVAPTEALAELDGLKALKVAVVRPSDGATTKRPPKTAKDPAKADALHKEAFQAAVRAQHGLAISKAKEAISYGCTSKCYKVIGLSHFKLGDSGAACKSYRKVGGELPSGLECP